MENGVDEPEVADAAATEGRAARASAVNVLLTESETAALAALLDPVAPAALVVEVATEVTVATQHILPYLSHRRITIYPTSEILAARVAGVVEDAPVRVEWVARQERPAREEPAATSPVATDETERLGRMVIQANPDDTARTETGESGASQARSPC